MVVLAASIAHAGEEREVPTDGGVLGALLGMTVGDVAVARGFVHERPAPRPAGLQPDGWALRTERARLASLGHLEDCSTRQCLEAARESCRSAMMALPEEGSGLCATERPSVGAWGWYAVGRQPGGACGVYLFAARGEQVVADRWCTQVPLEGHRLSCPEALTPAQRAGPRPVVRRALPRMVKTMRRDDREAIARVINAHLDRVTLCYERAALKRPGLAGTLELEWRVGAGKVSGVRPVRSTLADAQLEACVVKEVQSWRFPRLHQPTTVMAYPFMLSRE